MTKIVRLLFCVILLSACTESAISTEKQFSIRSGEWAGQNGDGTFFMQFTTASNVGIIYYAYPCGDRIQTVLPSRPIKGEVKNYEFVATSTDNTLSGRITITGTFVDSRNAEGTWEVSPFYDSILEIGCPGSQGTWTAKSSSGSATTGAIYPVLSRLIPLAMALAAIFFTMARTKSRSKTKDSIDK